MAQEKYGEAISLFRQAVETSQQQGVSSDSFELIPDVLQLARALWRNGDKAEAQTTMARCVTLQKLAQANPKLGHVSIGGKGAPDDGLQFEAFGNDEWLLYQGDFPAAARGFRAKIEFEEREQQFLDAEGMPTWEKLAEAEEGLGNREAAREAYARAAEQWEQRLSQGHPRAQWCRTRAADLPGRAGAR